MIVMLSIAKHLIGLYLIKENKMTFDNCFSVEYLIKMHKRCRCSKTHKKEVIGFELNLSENLVKISKEIRKGYKVSKYRRFNVYEPKLRLIESLPYKDRLVQMALCKGLIEPVIERRLVYDNAACRVNKGTHFALDRLKIFLNKFYAKYKNKGYFLKIDIHKYFASINHQILKEKLTKCNFDDQTRQLMFMFIDSKNSEIGKGLPLGNQTSQWFALLYLDEVDRFIKEKLAIKYYIRYMDDIIMIHHDKNYLQFCKSEIENLCNKNLKLSLNSKSQVGRLKDGIDFLGFRNVLTDSGKVIRVLRAAAKTKLKHKLKYISLLKQNSIVDKQYLNIRLAAFKAHINNSNSLQYYFNLVKKYNLN